MIKINLARQLQAVSTERQPSAGGSVWVAVVVSVAIFVGSGWWTYSQHQKHESLLQEKQVQTQSLAKITATVSRLEHYLEEKKRFSEIFQVMHAHESAKKQPMILLDGISRSVEGLEIWLDRVQMVDQVVELRGQSFALKDIGKYVDALENYQVITELPVVEILEQDDQESGKVFTFMIRFVLKERVAA
ncbi:MAG: PilN domain-containing protein [Nitrospirota bacterium]|nr:PilN domain-containing protein [Nitrospirota bacterium]